MILENWGNKLLKHGTLNTLSFRKCICLQNKKKSVRAVNIIASIFEGEETDA